ncbi:MAG: molybdopterin-dependent oxidoreductase [Candidatus Bathyarchaeia archaeon]
MLVTLTLSLLFTTVQIGNTAQATTDPIPLQGVEIQEYQGKDLSSINDFYENSINGPQYIDTATYNLTVFGLVQNNLTLTYNQILGSFQAYKKVVTLYCVEGWDVTILWEGILLKDILAQTPISPQANTLIFYAQDGYTTALPLDYIVDNNIMIAYKMNNVTLPAERGYPFELVAESQAGYKWIRWITQIEVSSNQDYLGYWESRGWTNNAYVSGPITPDQNGVFLLRPAPQPGSGAPEIPEFASWTIIPIIATSTVVLLQFRKKLNKKATR